MKKVSIIMGIFNCSSTLPEAIDSILSQTYENWELIMCDDGSNDNTYEIANKYRQMYKDKIVLIRNEFNKGLNYTLNHCLKYVTGDYVARMDGDDISLPNRFEEEVKFLDENPKYSIVSTPMIYFDESGIFRVGKGGWEPQITSFAKGTPFCHAPCMVKKEAYINVDGYTVKKSRLRVEDWDLWIRMYEKGYRGYVLETPLYKMRDDRAAYSRRKFKFRLNEALVCISAVKKLHLPFYYFIWMLRPIITGLLPEKMYTYFHKKKMGNDDIKL